jgi:hypothetical protein
MSLYYNQRSPPSDTFISALISASDLTMDAGQVRTSKLDRTMDKLVLQTKEDALWKMTMALLWDTQERAYHNTSVITKEAGINKVSQA